jgi:hypothetical protein
MSEVDWKIPVSLEKEFVKIVIVTITFNINI